MKKVFCFISTILFSVSVFAMDPMPPGPHTQTRYIPVEFSNLKPGADVYRDIDIVPLEGSTIWTSSKFCMRPEALEQRAFGRFSIIDTDNEQFYALHMIKSWQGDSCSELMHWDLPVHIQHPLKFRFRCNNYGTKPITCRGWLLIYAK